MTERGSLIYIVDDDLSVCRALSLLLKSHGFRVETFPRAAAFLAFPRPKVPSCLVLDVQLPDIDGLVLQDILATRHFNLPIIFITGHGNIPMSVKAIKAGAVDFLPKPFTPKQLLNALTLAIAKNKTENKDQTEIDKIKRRVLTLSPREKEVLHFVAKGLLNKEIAYKLGTVLQTIKVHRSRVMKKMQAKTVTELIQLAQKVGLAAPKP
ncbi:MAG: response regulator transcription factor [Candidatus Firestonebacteria bacterium]|nr:response regulator transcription factor [Candidatus Firestonebacteria bacterium]